MSDRIDQRPRRRIEMLAKISADSWRDLSNHLHGLITEIAMEKKLSTNSVSGGYSSGHIIVTSEDGTIDHDSWAKELNEYLNALDRPPHGTTEVAENG